MMPSFTMQPLRTSKTSTLGRFTQQQSSAKGLQGSMPHAIPSGLSKYRKGVSLLAAAPGTIPRSRKTQTYGFSLRASASSWGSGSDPCLGAAPP